MIPIHGTRLSFIHLVYYLNEIFHGKKKGTWNGNLPGIDDILAKLYNLRAIENYYYNDNTRAAHLSPRRFLIAFLIGGEQKSDVFN